MELTDKLHRGIDNLAEKWHRNAEKISLLTVGTVGTLLYCKSAIEEGDFADIALRSATFGLVYGIGANLLLRKDAKHQENVKHSLVLSETSPIDLSKSNED